MVRHLVARRDVDGEGRVVRPYRVRHGVIQAGQIFALGGEIDALTHLNLDFADHRLNLCVVVEDLEPGCPVVLDGDQFKVASVGGEYFQHLGRVEVGERRSRWLSELARRRHPVEPR